jgi:NADH dehydrogenase FAD-containing subunit
MEKSLVFVGGGHAHMTCFKRLEDFVSRGHRVTTISPSAYQYYSGMGPGMLAGTYLPQEIRFHVKKMVESAGGLFLEDTVTRVDPKRRIVRLHSGQEVVYDAVSFNTGSIVPIDHIRIQDAENVFTVKPILNLLKAQKVIRDLIGRGSPRILVVGGGPAGYEVAGNIWRFVHDNDGECRLTLLAGTRFLAGFHDEVRRLALQSFAARGIQVMERNRLSRIEQNLAVTSEGVQISFDLAILALGVRPSVLFRDSGLPTGKDGGLLLNRYLQSVAYPEIFGGGDCISFQDRPLDKVGVYAVRQNPILFHNLMAALEGGRFNDFEPDEVYLLIFNSGDGKAIFHRKNWVFDGRVAFLLKDYIDRRFMRKFQVSGELTES